MLEQILGFLQSPADLDGVGKQDFASLLFNCIDFSHDNERRAFSDQSIHAGYPSFFVTLVTQYVAGLAKVKARSQKIIRGLTASLGLCPRPQGLPILFSKERGVVKQSEKSDTRWHHTPCQISQTAQIAPQRCSILPVKAN